MNIKNTKQKGGVVVILIVLVLTALGLFIFGGSSDSPEVSSIPSQNSLGASYEEYSPEKMEKAKEGKVVIFFYANWCTTCRGHEKSILENIEDLPEGLTILKADFDTETELKKKYGVRFQHSFVQVDENGEMLKGWLSGQTIEDITSNLI